MLCIQSLATLSQKQGVSLSARVVYQLRTVARPVELRHALKVWLLLTAQSWHRPDTDVAAGRGILLANPESHQRAVRREPHRSNIRINERRGGPVGQVVKLSGTNLRNPDVHLSFAVGQKGHEMP